MSILYWLIFESFLFFFLSSQTALLWRFLYMFPTAQYSLILAVARFLNFYQCGSYQMVFCYSFSSCFPESPTGLSIVLCVLMSLAILISSSAKCLFKSFSFPLKLSFLTDCRSYSYTLDFFFSVILCYKYSFPFYGLSFHSL